GGAPARRAARARRGRRRGGGRGPVRADAQERGRGADPRQGLLARRLRVLCYGGGGPLHVAGYTEGVTCRDVLVPAWAAGFSAYGCACGDYEYRYDLTLDMPIEPTADEDEKAGIAMFGDGGWHVVRGRCGAGV